MKNPVFKVVLPLLLGLLYVLVTVIDYTASPEIQVQFVTYFFPMAPLLFLNICTVAFLLYYSRIPLGLNTSLLLGAAFLLGIGMWLLILHLQGARLLIAFAYLAITVLYMIRFVKKQTKSPLDILKLLFILSFVFINNRWLPFMRIIPGTMLEYIPLLLLLAILILLMLEGIKEKRTSAGEMRSSID